MTCSKDCANCMYGMPYIQYKCNDSNTTCCGECSTCPAGTAYIIRYYCLDIRRNIR